MNNKVLPHSLLTDFDIELFKAGKHFKLYEKLGAHILEKDGVAGCYFSVYAPAAAAVHLIGDFNDWKGDESQLFVRWDASGIWEGFLPGVKHGDKYKFKIFGSEANVVLEKADPFARYAEHPPNTASIVWDARYDWDDTSWMKSRAKVNSLKAPYSVYEVHLASWKYNIQEDRPLTYLELAKDLVEYVVEMKYTHVEFMPVMEHPFAPSWGYQVSSYFAPTSRFGDPEGFKALVDAFHRAGIGVILDWVPAHFPSDAFSLANFDGTHVYEHPDRRKGYHPDWKSLIFNFERNEIRAFLISSALFWLDKYHVDGIRVDAVASILYLDYSREDGEWEPNEFGGNENLAAISFIQDFNTAVYANFPDVQTIAEESTSYTGVTKPVSFGGLGFGMKWMMGWMHDTLEYFRKEPVYRRYHQNDLTFSMVYAFTEQFMLPLSHDEVVHGKGSILARMPGDEWQRFANLRTLYGFMFTHPGSKLLFMGCDFGQSEEWNFQQSLDWHLLQYKPHAGLQELIKALNTLYRKEPALYKQNYSADSFEWIDFSDHAQSVISYIRKCGNSAEDIIVVCNLTPIPRKNYRIGSPSSGVWKMIINTDDKKYFGSGSVRKKTFTAEAEAMHGKSNSLNLDLPPMAVICLKKEVKKK
jgi:1,4-alpha-glucan branching enzyme